MEIMGNHKSKMKVVAACAASIAIAAAISACGSSGGSTSAPPSTSAPQTYFAVAVSGAYAGASISDSEYLSTYTIDDKKYTFAQSIYTFGSGDEKGPQLDYSGNSAAASRGLVQLNITYSNSLYGSSVNNGSGISYDPPLDGNWLFELPQQAGSLVSLKGMPFVPAVAAQQCPQEAKGVNFEFVSLPTYVGPDLAGFNGGIHNWNPNQDVAYGLVQVSGSGSTVKFSGIQQFTAAGAKVTSYPDIGGDPPAITSISGACSSTFYGNTISVPGQVTISNPGAGETISAPAVVGIGPSGLLLENDGETSNLVSNAGLSGYQPFLGSGTGAIGFVQPSSQVDVGALQSAQFIGVTYGGGTTNSDWTSAITSFGFPSAPTGCPSGAFHAPLLGGDYPKNDPTQSPAGVEAGFGNCDLVIDLGSQDSSNNGMFRNSTVFFGAGFGGKASKGSHSFPATVIVGELGGKYAVFAIGVDVNGSPEQAWSIYLLQSN
jgi:hypothetical protein